MHTYTYTHIYIYQECSFCLFMFVYELCVAMSTWHERLPNYRVNLASVGQYIYIYISISLSLYIYIIYQKCFFVYFFFKYAPCIAMST